MLHLVLFMGLLSYSCTGLFVQLWTAQGVLVSLSIRVNRHDCGACNFVINEQRSVVALVKVIRIYFILTKRVHVILCFCVTIVVLLCCIFDENIFPDMA